MPRATYRGSLVKRKEEIPHKRARIEGSHISNDGIHNVTKSRNFSLCKDGQLGDTIPFYGDRGDQKPKNGAKHQGGLGSPLLSQNCCNSGIPSGKIEDRN